MCLIECAITWTVTQSSEKSRTTVTATMLKRSLSFTSAIELFILRVSNPVLALSLSSVR